MACPDCGLTHQCLCSSVPYLSSKLHLSLLTHSNEYQRASNTGQWLVKALPHCEHFTWQRMTPPDALLQRIANSNYHSVLVYPSEHSVPVENERLHALKTGREIHFILLDGTWQEAKKMLRKSAWLTLPHVHITPTHESRYQLRRNQQTGHLCTLEVANELLRQIHEPDNAQQLARFLDIFMQTWQADRSGHALPK